MDNTNIIGGVSPLKAKRQASRGGKASGAATKTGKQRGGYAKSKGKRGGGGANVGGYNVNTRFKSRAAWNKPPSGGSTSDRSAAAPRDPAKPYSYGPDGGIVINNNVNSNPGSQSQSQSQSQTSGTPGSPEEGRMEDVYANKTTETGGLESYQKVWDKNDNNLQAQYDGDFKKWTAAADSWWKNHATDEQKASRNKSKTTTREKVGEKYVKTKDAVAATSGTQSQEQTQKQN